MLHYLLALIMTLCLALPAHADDASSLKAEGDKLMDGLRYQDALAKYEASYKLQPDPALLYNQGRALEGLGRFPEALDKLVAFQEKASKELLDRLGRALATNINELTGRVALLNVAVDPPGATVRLGDRILGEAPLEKLRVNAGDVHFEFSRDGYFSEVLDVALKGGAENPISIKLSPRDNRALLKLSSATVGARVRIDGVPRGQVPLEVKLSPGPHLIVVEQDGHEPSESVVELTPLETKPLEVTLEATPITYEWWFWTVLGVGLTGGGVAVGLALTLEESADQGSLSPGQIQVGGVEETSLGGYGAEILPAAGFVINLPAVRF